MAGVSIDEKEELLDDIETPHLSHSRINRYLTCPEQYPLYYVEKLRPKVHGSGLVFGAIMHTVLAELFRAVLTQVSNGARPGLPARASLHHISRCPPSHT